MSHVRLIIQSRLLPIYFIIFFINDMQSSFDRETTANSEYTYYNIDN